MKPNNQLTPDDIEDLKAFATAVCRNVPQKRVTQLIESYVTMCMHVTNMMDYISTKRDDEQENAFGLAALVELYMFLKKNEVALKKLIIIQEEGEPFIYDPNDKNSI